MIGQMAISTALRGFSDLGRTVTPVFLLMDHFLYQFSAFSEKMKKIYRLEVLIFCKTHDRIPLFSAVRSSVRRFQRPFEGLSFVKTLVKFGIIYATDPLLQNKTKLVCLRWLTFDIFKVAGNSFQYFSRLRVCWVIISTLYLLTPTSWYQQTVQSSGNKFLLILWHNRLP